MLFYLRQIKQNDMVPEYKNFPVYVDSPLAVDATEIFLENEESCFDEEALALIHQGINPITFSGLKLTISTDESKAILDDYEPKVIISASGMCDAGDQDLWRAGGCQSGDQEHQYPFRPCGQGRPARMDHRI